jgi:uncharacterized caspase-like protein
MACIALTGAGEARAAGLSGVALVIGEGDYQQLPALPNPRSDARAIGELLYGLGFEVTSVSDADRGKLTRAIARFVEDAEEADVAIVYYSGHGVEVSGDNFLIPVDADIGTPDRAGASLISASKLLDELARAVPISIVLLDACRSNPFGPGQFVRLPGATSEVEVSTAGLVAVRGPTPLARSLEEPGSLGAVIGFAAEPGQPALDGPPGQNSPYAAALLRHLGAGGYSFADLMTLVAEEVYLRTEGRQRPWTNSGLRRVLTFGSPAESGGDSDERAILQGRRELLLSISTTPPAIQTTVATIASQEGVPMASLFGVLKAAGIDTDNPDKLSDRLIAGAQEIRDRLGRLASITDPDPEVARLLGLSARAESEGALKMAVEFALRASARTTELSAQLDSLAADIDKRRAENAAAYAAAGEAAGLAWEFGAAAEQFALAVAEAAKSRTPDPSLLQDYRLREAEALADLGILKGDDDALHRSVELYETLAEDVSDGGSWGAAKIQAGLAAALEALGERSGNTIYLERAVATYREALARLDRSQQRAAWATVQNNLGLALAAVGDAEIGTGHLVEAIDAFRLALTERTRDAAPLEWATTQNNLAGALFKAGLRDGNAGQVDEALSAYRLALEERTRERVPLDWAATQNNLGTALASVGLTDSGPERMEEAAVAFRNALEELARDRVPLQWAAAQSNLGWALQLAGTRTGDVTSLEDSTRALRLALEVYDRVREPPEWTRSTLGLGLTLLELGERTGSRELLTEGRAVSAEAGDAYKALGYNSDAYFADLMVRFDAAIARLE